MIEGGGSSFRSVTAAASLTAPATTSSPALARSTVDTSGENVSRSRHGTPQTKGSARMQAGSATCSKTPRTSSMRSDR
ncbi:UNVERIFIED_ORG: hypothetical protein QOE_2602, partial [Clostridioides difficile F501]